MNKNLFIHHQNEEKNVIKSVKKLAKQAFKIGEKNFSLTSDNTETTTSQKYNIETLREETETLESHLSSIQEELEDTKKSSHEENPNSSQYTSEIEKIIMRHNHIVTDNQIKKQYLLRKLRIYAPKVKRITYQLKKPREINLRIVSPQ